MTAWYDDAIHCQVYELRLEERIDDAWLAECAPRFWRRARGLR